jgi:hypothetical protein
MLTPHSRALLAAGERIVKSSVSVPRKYCSSMITTTLSAIPVYVGLVSYVSTRVGSASFAPFYEVISVPGLLLFSAAVFIVGYIPIRERLILSDIGNIQAAIDNVTNRRWWCAVIGTGVLFGAIILGVWTLLTPMFG